MKPTNLGKPSILTASSLFAKVNIVIADGDVRLAMLVKKLLYTLGCNRIFIVNDGMEVLELMKEEPIDIIITDWEMGRMGGLELATHLRQSLDSPNRMVPIVMLTARCDRADIRMARDVGITEYVVKPFSAKALLERVYAIVENPRGFVISKKYTGPDRRRISSLTLPPEPDETREFVERRPPLVVPKEHLKQIILDDQPRIIMPDYTLKKKLGIEVPPEIITHSSVIAQSEGIIHDAEAEFLKSIMKDVATLEEAYKLLLENPTHVKRLIVSIRESAFAIKSRAGTFGYGRASEVAGLLHSFCLHEYDRENKYHLIIVEKHIKTIGVIFAHKITGDGGQVGADLVKDLAGLIERYQFRKD